MSLLKKCVNGHYSMDEVCPVCGEKTFNPEPLKFSLADKHGRERRKMLYGVTSESKGRGVRKALKLNRNYVAQTFANSKLREKP